MKRNLLIGTSLAVASLATAEARYVATTEAAFKESTLRADAFAIAVKAFESETTEGKVALKAGETPTTLLNKALSEEAGRKVLAGILKVDNSDEASLRAALNNSQSRKNTLTAFARALSTDVTLRALVEEFRKAVVAQGSAAKKQGDAKSREEGPVQPVNPNNGTAVPVIVEESNYETLKKAVASAEKDLAQAITDEYHASRAAAEAAEAVKRALAAKDTASTNFVTATKAAEDAKTKATEAKTALTAAEKALEDAKAAESELTAQLPAAGAAIANPLAHNKLLADIKAREADIAIKQQAVTDAATRLAEAEKASKDAADKAAASKTVHEDAVKAFTDAEAASKAAADKAAAAETAQAEADTKLANAIKAALEVATKEATKAGNEAVSTRAAADAAELKKTELQTAAQTAKDRVIELGKRQTNLNSQLTAARAADTANSTADTQAAVKVKEAAVIAIATELAKAKIDAKHAEQAASDAVKVAAKTADAAVKAAEAKANADSNLSAATEKAENNTYIKALKEEIAKKEESRLAEAEKASKDAAAKEAAAKHTEAEKVSKDAAAAEAAKKDAADKAAEIAAAVADALAKAKAEAVNEKAAADAAAKEAAEKEAAAQAAAKDADAAAQAAANALAASTAKAGDVALKAAADAAAADATAAKAKQVEAEQAAATAKQAAVDAEAARVAAAQKLAATEQAVTAAKAEKEAADKRAADAEAAKKDAEQQLIAAKQAFDAEAAQNAQSARNLKMELNAVNNENDRLHGKLEDARNQISDLESQLNALAEEAKAHNPDKAFKDLIRKFDADLEDAKIAKDAAKEKIETLRSKINVDGDPLSDVHLTFAEVREIAFANDHTDLVEAIDAYFESSLAVETAQHVLETAKNLEGLSEVEGVEGKPSDAVARFINRHIAHIKSEALNRLLHSEEPSITVIDGVARHFKEFKALVDGYNSVKDLIDADVSETEAAEASLEELGETEVEVARGTDAAEESLVVDAKSQRDRLIGQLQTILKGFDIDAKPLNDALTLVSATKKRFEGTLKQVRNSHDDPFARLFSDLWHLEERLKSAISNVDGRYESVYRLLKAISEENNLIQQLNEVTGEIKKTEKPYDVLTTLSSDDLNDYNHKMRDLEERKRILEGRLQGTIDHNRYAHLGEEKAYASSVQNFTADTLGDLKLALAQYNDYLNRIVSSSDIDMLSSLGGDELPLDGDETPLDGDNLPLDDDVLSENDQTKYERIMREFDLTSVDINENLETLKDKRRVLSPSVEQKRIDAHAISQRMDSLLHDTEVNAAVSLVTGAKKLQELEAELEAKRTEANQDRETELHKIAHNNDCSPEERNNASEALQALENIKTDIKRLEADIADLTATAADVKDSAKLDAAKEKAKEYFDLETKYNALNAEFIAGRETLSSLEKAIRWLADASYNVDRKRRDMMLLGGEKFVAAITSAITAILNPVAAAEVEMEESRPYDSAQGAVQTDETLGDSAQGAGQNGAGFFQTVPGGEATLTSTVGFGASSVDTMQAPPPPAPATPPAAPTDPQAVVANGTDSDQSGDDTSSGSSTGSQAAVADTTQAPPPPPVAPQADVVRSQSGGDASSGDSGRSTPPSRLPDESDDALLARVGAVGLARILGAEADARRLEAANMDFDA